MTNAILYCMDTRYFIAGCLLAISLPLQVSAQPSDVASDAWYAPSIDHFVDAGYIDSSVPFRPTHNATRGEFIELLVKMLGGPSHAPYGENSFDDVSPTSALHPYFEEAGLTGWLKGTDNCYGHHPCTAKPNAQINRAEAAALMIRAFGLQAGVQHPTFKDNPSDQWFTDNINTAASRCILKGDSNTSLVRPADNMIRAEMVVMLERAKQGLSYPNCTTGNASSPNVPNSVSSSSNASPLSAPTGNTYLQCTAKAWYCSPSYCPIEGPKVSGSCVLIDLACLNPDLVKPVSSDLSCVGPFEKRMTDKLDKWKTLHEEMISTAKALIPQGAPAKVGIDEIAKTEDEFLVVYNEYVGIYNEYLEFSRKFQPSDDQKLKWFQDRVDRLNTLEALMVEIEKEFRAIPSVWY